MCPYSELFWSVHLRIDFECGKKRTRITPNTDIFVRSAIFEISLSNKCKQTEKLVITNVKSYLIMMLHSCYFSHLDPQWMNLKFNFTRLFPNPRILFSNIQCNCYGFEVFSSLILQICSLPSSIVSSSPIKNYRLK